MLFLVEDFIFLKLVNFKLFFGKDKKIMLVLCEPE